MKVLRKTAELGVFFAVLVALSCVSTARGDVDPACANASLAIAEGTIEGVPAGVKVCSSPGPNRVDSCTLEFWTPYAAVSGGSAISSETWPIPTYASGWAETFTVPAGNIATLIEAWCTNAKGDSAISRWIFLVPPAGLPGKAILISLPPAS